MALDDNSDSMRRRKAEVAEAPKASVESPNPQDEICVLNFTERVLMEFAAERRVFQRCRSATYGFASSHAEGKTALYDLITAALKHVSEGTLQRKAVVLLGDGGDNAVLRQKPAFGNWWNNRMQPSTPSI